MFRSSMQNYVFEMAGVPGQTERIAANDSVQSLPTSMEGAVAVLITCEENDIRFALGGTEPTQGASPVGHLLAAGQSIRLTNPEQVSTFRFINATSGQNGVLQVTPEF